MAKIEEVKRLVAEGLSDREIARTLHCRRTKVREIRELELEEAVAAFAAEAMVGAEPAWAAAVTWPPILDEIGRGFEIKRVWEERVAPGTSYANFWKYLSRRYPWLITDTVTLREFAPGSQLEVDWAGDKIPWWDERGRRHEAHVFVAVLCHSQLIYARAYANEQKSQWLDAHEKSFAFLGGCPRVVAPDNLKTGVLKAHRYDPDLNPAYMELARHYGVAVVPARVKRPKDKALVENAVGLVGRLLRWMYRNHRFRSLSEVNEALSAVIERLNTRVHTRFKISRRERFVRDEQRALRALPEYPFEEIDWREARVHPDCTIAIESAFYSVPHLHRGKKVRVKLTARQVEVFLGLERLALHARERSRKGVRVIDPAHLPPQALAYREATPQNLLSQARFLAPSLHTLLDELFKEDALGHIRRAQGFIRTARSEIHRYGRLVSEPRIALAVEQMRRFDRRRVSFFVEQLAKLRSRPKDDAAEREITRLPNNPMLRGSSAEAAQACNTNPPA